jgi:hypothetical protein
MEDYSKTFGPNKEMGRKWLFFYNNIKSFICVIWAFLGILEFLYDPDYYMNYFDAALYVLIPIAPALLGLTASVMAKINYKKFSKFIRVVLVADIIAYAYQRAIRMLPYLTSWAPQLGSFGYHVYTWFFLTCFVAYFVWYKPNVKYFEARVVDPFAEGRVMKESFFNKIDSINKRKAAEEEDEYGFKK